MSRLRKTHGGLLFLIGYILSPLSFWNDLLVNIPLAYLMIFWVGFIWPGALLPAFILAYWLTNLLGFMMMKSGAIKYMDKKELANLDWKKEVAVISFFTLFILGMAWLGVLEFPIDNPDSIEPQELRVQVLDLMKAQITE